MRLDLSPGRREAGAAAARWLGDRIREAVAARARAAVALSGGRSPAPMLDALAGLDLPWKSMHVFQVDERVAPDGHPDRNARMLTERLVTKVPIPSRQVHLMPVAGPDLEGAAARYQTELADACGGVLDAVHLGLGEDGHTASWPPGDAVLAVEDRDVAVVGPYRGRLRMTLTVPAVNRARHRAFLVTAANWPMVRRLLDGDRSIPAGAVDPEGTVVFCDAPAPVRGDGRADGT